MLQDLSSPSLHNMILSFTKETFEKQKKEQMYLLP